MVLPKRSVDSTIKFQLKGRCPRQTTKWPTERVAAERRPEAHDHSMNGTITIQIETVALGSL